MTHLEQRHGAGLYGSLVDQRPPQGSSRSRNQGSLAGPIVGVVALGFAIAYMTSPARTWLFFVAMGLAIPSFLWAIAELIKRRRGSAKP